MKNSILNYLEPFEYDSPEEEYVFNIKGREYQGYTYLFDTTSKLYMALEYADNFIKTFQEYYEVHNKTKLPSVKLFIINSPEINAFTRYEEKLDSFCIGLFRGACEALEKNVEESFEKLINVLIPEDVKEGWYNQIYVDAIRFFTAHEYAHIVCGHVTKSENSYLEFMEGEKTEEENMFQQMKEFQADQMAMAFMCWMAYLDKESRYNLSLAYFKESVKEFWKDKKDKVPELIQKVVNDKKYSQYKEKLDITSADFICHDLKMIMAGANMVFFTLDNNRKLAIQKWIEKENIPEEERNKFCVYSGLSSIRKFDHPLPSIRLDSVIRIMDECIESNEATEIAEKWENEVSEFVWLVEIYRNEDDLGKMYCHIAHTPTAQKFIREQEELWQKKKNDFPAIIPPLERLFYENIIIDMSDDGVLINQI